MRLALTAALLLLTGCSYERNGVVRHVIVGFGVVSVTKTNPVAAITRVQALGVHTTGAQVSVGYVNELVSVVDRKATNIVLEVK